MTFINQFRDKMEKEHLDNLVIRSFERYYNLLSAGDTGIISENEISAPGQDNILLYEDLEPADVNILKKLAVIKLNGGLGTSMGLSRAKSLLPVKADYNFLDLTALQVLQLREETGINLPLLFMNSYNTRNDTCQYLEKYHQLELPGIPLDFLQNKFPRIKQKDLSPLNLTPDHHNWSPPGHGEIYSVLQINGIIDILLKRGVEYVFVSNADNLGAVADCKIMNHLQKKSLPFLMEVCMRTAMDSKGGHLAQKTNGQLILREVAQCRKEDSEDFQDISKYKFFNTNNLWINLISLKEILAQNNDVLPLPLIVNSKSVNDIPVFQLESAMGAAISVFPGAKALVVQRDRFIPVKKTNDLLSVWSNVYELDNKYNLRLNKSLKKAPLIALDDNYYKTIEQLKYHFPSGAPALKDCNSLVVKGEIFFGKGIECTGDVIIESSDRLKIEDRILTGHIRL